MRQTKIAIIGGGSLRTLGVIHDWVIQGEVADAGVIAVMDLDQRRVNIISRLARQMPEIRGRDIRIEGTTSLEATLEGADFVYNVIRVGGVDGMERDKRTGARYGFHGHDDFGPSAAMITLRTVPVVLDLARKMERICPMAWLLNYTNPVPFIVRAVHDMTRIKVIGLCGGDNNQAWDIPLTLGWGPEPCFDFAYRGVGIDHFSWSMELTYKGRDFNRELISAVQKQDLSKMNQYCRMSAEVLQIYGHWLSTPQHCFHWTHHDEMVALLLQDIASQDQGVSQRRADKQEKELSAAEACIGQDLGSGFWQHPALRPASRPSRYEAIGPKLMRSMLTDAGEELMVNISAPGAVGNLQPEGIVLISARLTKDGPKPYNFTGVPPGIAPLTRQILEYQGALVKAAIEGSRKDLEAAIFMDPLMRSIKTVRAMLDELLKANESFIRRDLLRW